MNWFFLKQNNQHYYLKQMSFKIVLDHLKYLISSMSLNIGTPTL